MSEDLCNALEELTEEEKKAEILPISVQQFYVLLQSHQTEAAEQLKKEISISEYV